MEKAVVRQRLLTLRESLSDADRLAKSRDVESRLRGLESLKESQTIALYYPVRGEVLLWGIFKEWIGQGKRVVFPRVKGELLVFSPALTEKDFVDGRYGVPHPESSEEISPEKIDCLVLPGVGFNLERYRLGFGKGYYDRFVSGLKGCKIGVAYDFQIVPDLPYGPGDLRCDWVVTEKRIIGGT